VFCDFGLEGAVKKITKNENMKFFKKLNPVERKIMILKSVQSSALIEGMQVAVNDCQNKINRLEKRSSVIYK